MYHGMRIEVRGQLEGVSSVFLPRGFQASNIGRQDGQQVPLPPEPLCQLGNTFWKLLNIVEIMEGTNTIRMRYEHCLHEVSI